MVNGRTLSVAVYPLHEDVFRVVRELSFAEFNMKNVSVIGKDYRCKECVTGYYSRNRQARYWGHLGMFWTELWETLTGSAFLFIPGIGAVAAAGPIVSRIAEVLEEDISINGLSVIGEAFCKYDILHENAADYEECLKENKFIVICQGSAKETLRVNALLEKAHAAL